MIVSRSYWKRNNWQFISIYDTIQLTEPQIRDWFSTCIRSSSEWGNSSHTFTKNYLINPT